MEHMPLQRVIGRLDSSDEAGMEKRGATEEKSVHGIVGGYTSCQQWGRGDGGSGGKTQLWYQRRSKHKIQRRLRR